VEKRECWGKEENAGEKIEEC
jgi:hypothetical protein